MLQYAIDKARKHISGGRVNVYAIATNKHGRIIVESGNSYLQSHPVQYKMAKAVGLGEKQFLHAEIACLIACMRKRVVPHTIYIARVRRNGDIAPACPCPICSHAISLAGIEHIITT